MGFSAVGSLREEVKPRDFVVGEQVVDWTRGVSFYMDFYWRRAKDGESISLEGGMRVEG